MNSFLLEWSLLVRCSQRYYQIEKITFQIPIGEYFVLRFEKINERYLAWLLIRSLTSMYFWHVNNESNCIAKVIIKALKGKSIFQEPIGSFNDYNSEQNLNNVVIFLMPFINAERSMKQDCCMEKRLDYSYLSNKVSLIYTLQ